MLENNTYVLESHKPEGELLRSMFVFASKVKPDGTIGSLKARLVANGKPQWDTNSFAPTPRWSTIRFFLKLITDLGLFTQQVDVTQAYLLSLLPADDDISIHPPKGYPYSVPRGKVFRLRKCLYGLKQSGRHWNKNVHEFLSSIQGFQFKRCEADPCLYIDKTNAIYILVFVDDFIIAGQKHMVLRVLYLFRAKYPIKELGELHWYLKCRVKIGRDWLHFSQQAFACSILEEAGMTDCNHVDTPCEDFLYADKKEAPVSVDKAKKQRNITGKLLYLCIATRPDISFSVVQLCKHMAVPTQKVWSYTKRILRYLKGTLDYGILYSRNDNSQLVGYSDSDYAGCKVNRKSMTGIVWNYGGDVISYKCKQQSTIADSSMYAELIAMTSVAKEVL